MSEARYMRQIRNLSGLLADKASRQYVDDLVDRPRITNLCTDPKPLDVDNWQGVSASGNLTLDSTYADSGLNAVWDHSVFGEAGRIAPNGNGVAVNPLLPTDFVSCATYPVASSTLNFSFKMMSELALIPVTVRAEGYTSAGAYVTDLDPYMSAPVGDGTIPAMTVSTVVSTFDGESALIDFPTAEYAFVWFELGVSGGTLVGLNTWLGSAMVTVGTTTYAYGDADTEDWYSGDDGTSSGPAPDTIAWSGITGLPSSVTNLDALLATKVESVTGDGTTATVDNTDPLNPIVSAIGGGSFSGDAVDLTGGPAPAAVLGTGTPTSAKYLRGDGAWTVPAATEVSGFDTQVRTSRLDQMAAPTADVSMNTHKITNVTDPASAQDADTKAARDAAISAALSGGAGAATDSGVAGLVADAATPSLTRAALDAVYAPLVAAANPATKSVAMILAKSGSSAVDPLGIVSVTATGSNIGVNVTTASQHAATKRILYRQQVASTTNVAGWRADPIIWRGNGTNLGGFKAVFRFGPDTGQTVAGRMFTGLTVSTAAPTDVQPSTLVDCIGVGYDAADTQLYVIHNDSSGTATKVATALTRSSVDSTKVYTLTISCASNASTLSVTILDENAGTSFTTAPSTDLPSNASFLTPRSWCSVGGVNSVIGIALMAYYSESIH